MKKTSCFVLTALVISFSLTFFVEPAGVLQSVATDIPKPRVVDEFGVLLKNRVVIRATRLLEEVDGAWIE